MSKRLNFLALSIFVILVVTIVFYLLFDPFNTSRSTLVTEPTEIDSRESLSELIVPIEDVTEKSLDDAFQELVTDNTIFDWYTPTEDDIALIKLYFRGTEDMNQETYLYLMEYFYYNLSIGQFEDATSYVANIIKTYKYPTNFDVNTMMLRYFDASYAVHLDSIDESLAKGIFDAINYGDVFATAFIKSSPTIQKNFAIHPESLIVTPYINYDDKYDDPRDYIFGTYLSRVPVDRQKYADLDKIYPDREVEVYTFSYEEDTLEVVLLKSDLNYTVWGTFFSSDTPKSILSQKQHWK